MFPPYPQQIRLVEDRDGHIQVVDTVDWQIVLTGFEDAAGQPLDLTGATLHMELRPEHLPGQLVDDLSLNQGITVSAGPTITVVSRVGERTWRAKEATTLIGDLIMTRSSGNTTTTTFLRRIYVHVKRSATRT